MNNINSIGYEISFQNSLNQLISFIDNSSYTKFFILTDEITTVHCLPALEVRLVGRTYDLIEVSAGEECKNLDFCIGVWKMLIDFNADRKSLLINLGGGVVTDMGGFIASTYKRGIDFVNVPTTLLSQVDASVGGKTGVDLDSIKNIIGTFTQPKAVFIAHEYLSTLPERQILSGLAEMLKHGLIKDQAYWNDLKNSDLSLPSAELVYRSVEIKNEVVIADPHEKGIRKALNFGHTVGHAVETFSLDNDKRSLTHGEAIAIGMVCESWLSCKKSGLSQNELDEIVGVLMRLYPKYNLQLERADEIITLMRKDKKNEGNKINCTLLVSIGNCLIDQICSEDELRESLEFYAGL
ncbi:3-dehydroquinate synthase [Mucilaginibacter ginkgonis]|uniref:3-dehydroquinate synthase n=1 Tax=Mucilaginibacter ginkgonis TaxID=2682091 RepID=A0A6I4HXD0_9SPHI|nr:3-dehydroquinate synthase [Mucilaginibacter ginkgonis]QQL51413.1 3-dehydroquinate synthase [Mucilaginibacter ginkgonis]